MPTNRADFLRSGLIAVLAGFVLMAGMIGTTLWFVSTGQSTGIAVRHTLAVESGLYQLQSLLQDAETGQRGYLLSGDETYLAPYSRAVDGVDAAFQNLTSLLADSSPQNQALSALRGIARQKLTELKPAIDARRAGRTDAALAQVRAGGGKALMNQARDIVTQMLDIETGLLGRQQAAAATAARGLEISVVITAALLLLLGVFTLSFAARQLRRVMASRDAMKGAHDRLLEEVAQREHVESQLRQLQKMEAIGQLTGGLAHDFNNMLSVVIGSLTLLERRHARGDADLKRFIDAAMDGAQRAATLTHRLLAFSRQQPLTPEPIDANRLVAGMSDLLRRTLGEAVQLETVLGGGLWQTNVDATQLENALLNLAVNARDAMPEGGRLTIETANAHLDEGYAARHLDVPAGQYVLLAVTDTGTGMPADVIARAFDPFFTTKPPGKGTGMGLAQVYGFMKQSSGHVRVYSEPGHGTTVKLYMPRHFGERAEPSQAAPVAAPAPPAGDPREVILVVEDEDRVRQLTVESLRELGYTVLHADGATVALRLLDSRPEITLLFTDVVMPDVNGRKLAEEAWQRRPELKVLFTTGYTRNAIIHNGVLDPGLHLISKPFTLDQLAVKMREVLERA